MARLVNVPHHGITALSAAQHAQPDAIIFAGQPTTQAPRRATGRSTCRWRAAGPPAGDGQLLAPAYRLRQAYNSRPNSTVSLILAAFPC